MEFATPLTERIAGYGWGWFPREYTTKETDILFASRKHIFATFPGAFSVVAEPQTCPNSRSLDSNASGLDVCTRRRGARIPLLQLCPGFFPWNVQEATSPGTPVLLPQNAVI